MSDRIITAIYAGRRISAKTKPIHCYFVVDDNLNITQQKLLFATPFGDVKTIGKLINIFERADGGYIEKTDIVFKSLSKSGNVKCEFETVENLITEWRASDLSTQYYFDDQKKLKSEDWLENELAGIKRVYDKLNYPQKAQLISRIVAKLTGY